MTLIIKYDLHPLCSYTLTFWCSVIFVFIPPSVVLHMPDITHLPASVITKQTFTYPVQDHLATHDYANSSVPSELISITL